MDNIYRIEKYITKNIVPEKSTESQASSNINESLDFS